ncbi:MAG: hypothetical protein ACRDI2_04860 [Chloroflexota bacterium]
MKYWLAVAVLGILAAAGVVAVAMLAAGGPEPRAKWGYAAATLAFLLSAAHGAPVLAFATRLGRGPWGIPLRRAAELFTVAGLVTAPLFVVLLWQLPGWEARPSIWLGWPGAPQLWDSLAIILFSLLGVALLYTSSLPDLAVARDAGAPGVMSRLALGWTGTVRQWRVLSLGVVALGALYLMLFTFVHLLVSSDLALSLVPGWASAVIPPYHALSGLQAGVAATVLALAALRRVGGLAPYADIAPFRAAAKLLLALSLLVFWFIWSEFLTLWYGRMPEERRTLALLMFGPYVLPFVLSLSLNVLCPLVLLIWNPVRESIAGVTLVAGLVVAGNYLDRVRIYVAAWSVAGPVHVGEIPEPLPPLPPAQYPGLLDVLIMLGGPAAVLLLYVLALRLAPPVSLWERNLGRLLRTERPYVKTELAVVAKPS